MADNLTNDQRKWILKQYQKKENAERFQQKWAEEFDSPPLSRQTIYRICDKFVMLQKVVDRSVLPPRKMKCESSIYEEPPKTKTKSCY